MKKEDPKLFKRMQDMGIIGKSWQKHKINGRKTNSRTAGRT